MRADAEGLDLVGLLVPDPGIDDVGREDVAAKQELVIIVKGVQTGFQRPRGGRDLLQLFGLKVADTGLRGAKPCIRLSGSDLAKFLIRVV